MIGIYCITNLCNGIVYIGQSRNISQRLAEHRWLLRNNNHTNYHLQNAWNKYGEANFEFKVVEECSKENLTDRENFWISKYGGVDSDLNYNLTAGQAHGGHSSEIRSLISISSTQYWETHEHPNKGTHWSAELRNRQHISRLGKKHSEETRRKISEAQKGKKLTLAQRQHLSELAKGRTSPNKGKPMSEEQKAKLRGIKRSEETIQKMRESKLGKPRKGKSVLKYTKDGYFIGEYSSLKEGAASCNVTCKYPEASISAVCRGREKSAFGYVWKYKE